MKVDLGQLTDSPFHRGRSRATSDLADDPEQPRTPLPGHRLFCVSGGIFLLRGGDDLVPMTEAPYDSEDVLQELLAKFPDLLAGDQLAGATHDVGS